MTKMIELTLVNNKQLLVVGANGKSYGKHKRGESKPYPEEVALSLLNNPTWARTKKSKEVKE
jgi:hypothetical protein